MLAMAFRCCSWLVLAHSRHCLWPCRLWHAGAAGSLFISAASAEISLDAAACPLRGPGRGGRRRLGAAWPRVRAGACRVIQSGGPSGCLWWKLLAQCGGRRVHLLPAALDGGRMLRAGVWRYRRGSWHKAAVVGGLGVAGLLVSLGLWCSRPEPVPLAAAGRVRDHRPGFVSRAPAVSWQPTAQDVDRRDSGFPPGGPPFATACPKARWPARSPPRPVRARAGPAARRGWPPACDAVGRVTAGDISPMAPAEARGRRPIRPIRFCLDSEPGGNSWTGAGDPRTAVPGRRRGWPPWPVFSGSRTCGPRWTRSPRLLTRGQRLVAPAPWPRGRLWSSEHRTPASCAPSRCSCSRVVRDLLAVVLHLVS